MSEPLNKVLTDPATEVYLEIPPLVPIESLGSSCIQGDIAANMSSSDITIQGTSISVTPKKKRKVRSNDSTRTTKSKVPRYEQPRNLIKMHEEHLTELRDINSNLGQIVTNLEKHNQLFAQLIETLKAK